MAVNTIRSRSRVITIGVASLGGKSAVAEPFAVHAPHHRGHLVYSVIRSLIMPSRELADVAVKMLRAHLVVRPVVAALEHRPEALNAVRVGHPTDVLPDGMLHRFVIW